MGFGGWEKGWGRGGGGTWIGRGGGGGRKEVEERNTKGKSNIS